MYVEKFRGGDLDKGELLQLYIYGIYIPYFHSSTVVFQTSLVKIYDELKFKRVPFFK